MVEIWIEKVLKLYLRCPKKAVLSTRVPVWPHDATAASLLARRDPEAWP